MAILESLQTLKRSDKDKKIAGVCGGLGEHTSIPSWIWRVIFLMLLFLDLAGLILYIILWICMPKVQSLGSEFDRFG